MPWNKKSDDWTVDTDIHLSKKRKVSQPRFFLHKNHWRRIRRGRTQRQEEKGEYFDAKGARKQE